MERRIQWIVLTGFVLLFCGCGTLKNKEPATTPAQEARRLVERGEYEAAVRKYTEALSTGDVSYENFFYRGVANQKLGRQRAAVADFTKAHSIRPNDNGRALLERCRLNYALKEYADAEKNASLLLKMAPKNRELIKIKALSLFALQKYEDFDTFIPVARAAIQKTSPEGLQIAKCYAISLFRRRDAEGAYRVFIEEYVKNLKEQGRVLSKDDRQWAAKICDVNLKNAERDFYLGR